MSCTPASVPPGLYVGRATHIAGPEVQAGSHVRQRCAWCGVILADTGTHGPAMWAAGDLVRSDGDAFLVFHHEEGAELPADSCAMAEVSAGLTLPTPAVSHIVHYVSYGTPVQADGTQAFKSRCRAAVITDIPDLDIGPDAPPEVLEGLPNDLVSVCVLNPSGIFFDDVEHDEDEHRGGTWHWPERQEPAAT